MLVFAITGFSGSGKTTLIVRLIEHFVREGLRVGAIKHTHHPVNHEDRGDTGRFRRAGAEPVILAGAAEAVLFDRDGTRQFAYERPEELLQHFATDVVLVEGFKQHGPWRQIEIRAEARPTLEEVLDRIAAP